MDPKDFWARVKSERERLDADEILVYLKLLVDEAQKSGKPLTEALLNSHGASVPFFDGVTTWFARMNGYAHFRNLNLEQYVISSGNEEIIRGCRIAAEFTRIFGSKFLYGDDGTAVWPGVAVNYTTKTQYLFRINKGVMNHWESERVNRWVPMPERPIPFSRMIYLGDGDTDIPSMKMIRHQGGHSIAVFDPALWEKARTQEKVYNLIAEDRAHFVVPADYRATSQLDVTVKGVLGRIARDEAGYREGAA